MANRDPLDRWRTRVLNRHAARRSARQKAATGFVSQPEPKTIGSFARGRQLLAGNIILAGHFVEAPGEDLWEIEAPDPAFDAARHGFGWLDDLAAVGDVTARARAQDWLWGWIARYGQGQGPGWTPDLTGRRLIRWICHAIFLLRGRDTAQSMAFYRLMSAQTWYLARRWNAAVPGLPRFEALTGLIYAGFSLEGKEHMADPAITALARECNLQIDSEGGLPTRNPEELLEVFTLLTWAAGALGEAERTPPDAHLDAIERIAPTLRTLRHSDGGLARFHGGGRGPEGRLDLALSTCALRKRHADGLAMGYARLSSRRTSVIIDAAPPPEGAASFNAHASTLAFELTSGRRPLIVNCGSGKAFGADWRRAGRATPSHSVLCLDGYSSARLTPPARRTGRESLIEGPTEVPVEIHETADGLQFQGGHDGYKASHGLTHARTLELSVDGRGLAGEDMLLALEDPEKRRFDKVMDAVRLAGIGYDLRFHLHPDVDAEIDMGGAAVSMALKSGEIWIFRHDGKHELKLEPSVYLETGRLKPRATKQIVISGRAMGYATRIRWSLAKAQDTAIAVRDLAMDDLFAAD
ncbi:MAG: heparinase [Rhodobacteraceae bacterium]|nr:heparinase [Paracoccaceae bacterium]